MNGYRLFLCSPKLILTLAGTCLLAQLEVSLPRSAIAFECVTTRSGDRMCMHSVYSIGGTSIKEVTVSANGGSPTTHTIDCSRPKWEFGSTFDRACSLYR